MASVHCSRGLTVPRSSLRLAPRITPIIAWTAPFSTTPAVSKVAGAPKKAFQVIGRHIRRGKVAQNSKKKPQIVRAKKPQPGQRKAFRKRIQLSNNNAAVVDGLPVLEAETMANKENLCRMVGLPDKLVDQLRALEAFKPTQFWGLFRKPHMLVRTETVSLMERLNEAATQKQTLRTVLTGGKNSGKSLMLLQAMSHGLLNEWVVINIPEAQDLVNANTEYSPIPNSSPLQFFQPAYCLALLQKIAKANGEVLKQYKLSKDYSELQLIHLPEDGTLYDLAAAAKEAEFAWPVVQALWHELTAVPGRPPVLVTIDGLSHLMKQSAYRDPSFHIVHAHDLTLVRLLVDALAGNTAFANGGAVLAGTSRSNAPRSPSMDLALAQVAAEKAGEVAPSPDPYRRDYDARVYEAVRNVDVLEVNGISKLEARAVMEYWAASGVLRSQVNETTVTEKWSLSGHGILGEMERAALENSRL
ncbi:mitochondrial ribosomal protein [Sodiomyces alkalinus F11]|uniref:Small ribosomal subunit protein mS29 n=1 Tax=Sodiomyces alkalinus (strain CBS 110278 / VKM F-3762 / F11) TaxID=1314773 RepID=A0A3N2PRV3_SODAK|nr:mitochondrial ribosomal protein [Sodiomyces alkalinus F11]ROT37241.1 mitochondrial ribosomal protein [Sodiomyces alkalinus F11]